MVQNTSTAITESVNKKEKPRRIWHAIIDAITNAAKEASKDHDNAMVYLREAQVEREERRKLIEKQLGAMERFIDSVAKPHIGPEDRKLLCGLIRRLVIRNIDY